MRDVILSTTPTLPGYKIIELLGIIYGMSIRTRGLGGKIMAGLEALAGGRGESYLSELRKARNEAIEDLKMNAERVGANAVIAVDFETTEILEGFIVVTAYGTAVKAVPETQR